MHNLWQRINNLNPLLIAVLLFLFSLLWLLPFHNYLLAEGDLAEHLNNPVRILHGQMPYKDFWLLLPPGEVYLPALIYKIFGLNINYVIIFNILIQSFIVLLGFNLVQKLTKSNSWALLAAFFIFFYGAKDTYQAFIFLASLAFLKHLKKQQAKALFWSGLFLGLAFCFKFYETGAVLACFFTVLLIELIYKKKRKINNFLKPFYFLAFGLLIIFIPFLILSQPFLNQMIFQVITDGLKDAASMSLPYFAASLFAIKAIASHLDTFSKNYDFLFLLKGSYRSIDFIKSFTLYLLPLYLFFATPQLFSTKNLKKEQKKILWWLWLWGLFLLPKGLVRGDLGHLSFANTAFLLLLLYQLFLSFSLEFKKLVFMRNMGITILIFLLFAAPASAKELLSKIVKKSYPVKTNHGTLILKDPKLANDLRKTINFIQENTSEKDYIFVTSWYAPPLYALNNRLNPTFYDSLIILVIRSDNQKQLDVCRDLVHNNTKIIVHSPDWGFDDNPNLRFQTTNQILQKCIEDNFVLKVKYGQYWLFMKR